MGKRGPSTFQRISRTSRKFIIDNKIDQIGLLYASALLHNSPIPPPLKMVGDNIIGNLAAPRNKKSNLISQFSPNLKNMSPCVRKMFNAITSPWSPSATGACIPVFPARPSQKVTGFCRFDIYVGTNGTGFVAVSPTLATDSPVAIYSNSSYTGTGGPSDVTFTAATGVIATTGVASVSMTNLGHASTSFVGAIGVPPAVRGRVISSSVSIQYTGTTLEQSGLIYCYTDPAHDSTGNFGVNSLSGRKETDVTPTTRDKCWVTSYPITRDECDYERNGSPNYGQTIQSGLSTTQLSRQEFINILYPFSNGSDFNASASSVTSVATATTYAAAPMCIIISGATPGNSYHVEIVTHVEYIGPGVEGRSTMSEFDTIGAEKLLGAVGKLPDLKASNPGVSDSTLLLRAMKL